VGFKGVLIFCGEEGVVWKVARCCVSCFECCEAKHGTKKVSDCLW